MTRSDSGPEPTASFVTNGVDIVGIARIARLLEDFGDSFERRVFTPAERAYCERRPDPAQHYAARWATKEAFRKVVSTDGPFVPFDAVGVTSGTDGPTLDLGDPAEAALVHTLGRANVPREQADTSVSLAHDRPAGYAIAHVVLAGWPAVRPRDRRPVHRPTDHETNDDA